MQAQRRCTRPQRLHRRRPWTGRPMKGAATISSSTKQSEGNGDAIPWAAKLRQLIQARSMGPIAMMQFTSDGLADLRHELEDATRFDKEGTRE